MQRNRYLNDSSRSLLAFVVYRFVFQEAKVDHDGPDSSNDHNEEEREEEAAEDEGESHEAKEEQEPSSFAAVLEEIKAYGMLLARETQVHVFSAVTSLWPTAVRSSYTCLCATQRHLHNIATEFYEQLKQEMQKCEAITQAQCQNYLAGMRWPAGFPGVIGTPLNAVSLRSPRILQDL